MKNLIASLLDLIYRKKCYFCSNSKHSVKMCPDCFESLEYSEFRPSRIIDGVYVYSCGIYEQTLQKLIRGLKYHKQKELAYYLAKFMFGYFDNLNISGNFQVVPVPLHKNRIKKRKYNHMELVADEFCKFTGFTLNTGLITRIKDTKPQYKLSKTERMKNLADAFEVDIKNDLKLPIIILDDICTTGSTFEEMIKELKKSGLNEIICISSSNP